MPDVIVIGGGIHGCALAYELRGAGRSVVVLERHGVGHEGSGRNAGGVRQQGRVPEEIPLAMEAAAMWPGLADQLGGETEYVREGNLLIAGTESQIRRVEDRYRRQAPFGLPSTILDATQLRALCPIVGPGEKVALYCPTDGHANPLLSTLAYAAAARRRGARIVEGAPAESLRRTSAGWSVGTPRGTFEAEVVINAAGPGAVDVCRLAGVSLPIANCRVQTMVTERLPPIFAQFVQDWDAKSFTRQTVSGNVIYGDLTEDYVVTGHEVLASDCVRSTRAALQAFPGYADVTVLRAWGGTLDVSRDQMPIIGELPGRPGLFVDAGSSGHGFALAPAVARLLAARITRGERSPLLGPFSPRRFSSTGVVDNIDDGAYAA